MKHIQLSVQSNSLTINLPWILEYLKASGSTDAGNIYMYVFKVYSNSYSKTKQFTEIINHLKSLYHSPLLSPMSKDFNPNYLFVITELEEFFEIFHLDPFRYDTKQVIPVMTSQYKCIDADRRIIDEHFIQLCSPFLDDIYTILRKANMKNASQLPIKKDRGSVTPLTQDTSREVLLSSN